MNDLARCLKEWLASEEGVRCADPTTLAPEERHRVYMENRLREAFVAGFNCGEASKEARLQKAVHKLLEGI